MPHRVLVVDCDRAAAGLTAQQLATAGYVPDIAESFQDAVQQIARQRPDLVITPVRLGQFNGLHLVLRCRAEYPPLPVLVTIDDRDAGLTKEIQQQGVRFVQQSADSQQVLRVVSELVAGPEAAG